MYILCTVQYIFQLFLKFKIVFQIQFLFNPLLLNWLVFYFYVILPKWPCRSSGHGVRNSLFVLLKMDVIFGEIVLTHGFIYKMVHRSFLWAGQIVHNYMLLCENYKSIFEYIIFWFGFSNLSPDSQNFLKPLV